MASLMLSPRRAWLVAIVAVTRLSCGASWDYSKNGANWGALGECGLKTGQQSPINLPAVAEVADGSNLFLKYPMLEASFQLYHNGNSIALTLPDSYKAGFGLSKLLGAEKHELQTKDGEAYRLWQVNFHSPAEHTLKGRRFPLEMQMMHQRVTGGGPETAVVVVLFEDAANSYLNFLDKLLANGLPQKAWEEKVVSAGVEFSDVVGGSPYYHYTGSLTVPPCEMKVKYYIRQEPIKAAHDQLSRFQKVLHDTCVPSGNFRLAQPLTGPLTLMSSVDVVKAPGNLVKAKNAKVEKNEATPAGREAGDFECSSSYWDEQLSNVARIRVGESKELIAAKEKFNREKREYQVAQSSKDGADRNLKLQQSLYDNAPGLTEQITQKWNLVGAETVLQGASVNLAKVGAVQAEELARFKRVLQDECNKIHEARIAAEASKKAFAAEAAKTVVKDNKAFAAEAAAATATEAAAKAPIPKFAYPEPHVALPHGLAASPFAGKGVDTAPKKAGADAGEGSIAKLAPNLHQPDMPPSSSAEGADGKDLGVKDAAESEDIIMRLDLPISAMGLGDKEQFKADFTEALAASGKFDPSRLEVKELKAHEVSKVHTSLLMAERELIEPPPSSIRFLQHHHTR